MRRRRQSEIQMVRGIWTPRVSEMTDVRRNSRTMLRLDKLEFNIGLKDEDFTVQARRRDQ